MKRIISLNLAGRKDFNTRLNKIVRFLDAENADIVCLQEVTFNGSESLAHTINSRLRTPYPFIQADLAETYERNGKQLTDGLAILSKTKIINPEVIALTKVPEDENGRPDFHKRIAQIIELSDNTNIVNTHLASNNNSHLQFQELLKLIPDSYILTGDFNLPKPKLLTSKALWDSRYSCSILYKDYISFPKENQTFDYFFIPKDIKITDLHIIEGLSDHNTLVCDIDTYPSISS